MLRRILRIAALGALGKAWRLRDARWLGVGVAVLALRFFESRAKKRSAPRT
ncbi:MAG TPA: hypothetical protein VGG21_03415 [Acidimicrobiales bacterium]